MPPAKLKLYLQYALVFSCAALVYSLTCAPGLLWQDSGVIQYRVLNYDVEGVYGLALAHPLFYDLAYWVRALPVGALPWRINMIAALAAAVALANLFLFMRLWLGPLLPALVTVLSLGLAHTFWQHACMAETYTLWCALFTAELLLFLGYRRTGRRGYLFALALTDGLALSVHLLALISAVCFGVYFLSLARRRVLTIRHGLGLLCLWLLGSLPYGWLVAQAWVSSGDAWGTLSSALFGDRWQSEVLNVTISLKIVKENFLFLALNFPTPNLILALLGAVGLFRMHRDKGLRAMLLSLTLLYLLFAGRYTVPDRYAFFIPFYCLLALFIGVGVHTLQVATRDLRRHIVLWPLALGLALLPILVYAAAPAWARAQRISLGTRSDLVYRDDYRYFLQPWKSGERGAAMFATEALSQVEANALIYADMTTVPALLFVQQHQGLRPDVAVVSERLTSPGAPPFNAASLAQLMDTRSIYVVSRVEGYCPRFVLEGYRLQRRGLLWQVQETST